MAGDDFGIVDIQARKLGAHTGHKLVGGAVRTVAADAVFFIVFVRQAIHVGVGRHGLVEGGVEGNHLRHGREHLLHGADAQQVGRVVQRGEVCAEGNLVNDVVVYQDRAAKKVSALHDAVPHGLNVLQGLEHARLLVRKGGEDELHAHFMVRDGNILYLFFTPGGSILKNADRKADFFADTLGDNIENVVALHVQKLVLDGRAAAVDNKNNHKLWVI